MNVLQNQWSVSGQTVAVMQLSGSVEMGRVERGVPSSRPRHHRVHSTRQHSGLVEDALAYWKPVELSKEWSVACLFSSTMANPIVYAISTAPYTVTRQLLHQVPP